MCIFSYLVALSVICGSIYNRYDHCTEASLSALNARDVNHTDDTDGYLQKIIAFIRNALK